MCGHNTNIFIFPHEKEGLEHPFPGWKSFQKLISRRSNTGKLTVLISFFSS